MKTKKEEKILSIFKILGDENKLKIILHLMCGEECVCNMAEKVGVERTLVSHNLKILREAGIIHDRKLGTWVHCSLNKKWFDDFSGLLTKYLNSDKISDEMCCLHDECKCLIKGEKNEK